MFDTYFKELYALFNEQKAYLNVYEIYNNDRWNCFSGYKKTAAFCAEQMKTAGLAEVEMLPLNADGRSAYFDWVIPKAWDAVKGTLTLLELDGSEKILADYSKTPCSLMMYSAETPPGGINAELIDYDASRGFPDQFLEGKLLLTGNAPGTVVDRAVKAGAAGILSDFIPLYPGIRDNKDNMMDISRWENGLLCPENTSAIFGFSVSPRIGDLLRGLLKEEAENGRKVVLRAEVEAKFSQGIVYTVSGLIPGTDPDMDELLVLSHLYETGANDNATGCGAALELASAISEGITKGILQKPKCGIRFVMGFECAGPAGYFARHPVRMAKTAAAINLDMVGSIAEENAILSIWHNPMSNWSFIDTLILEIISRCGKYLGENIPFKSISYSIGDNLIADPMLGIPTVSMLMYPSVSYHSSMDDMSRVCPAVLKRNAVIAGTMLLFISTPDTERVHWLLGRIRRHAEDTILSETARGPLYRLMLAKAFLHGCNSLLRFSGAVGDNNMNAIAEMVENIKQTMKHSAGEYQQEPRTSLQQLIPFRKVPGPITFHTLPYALRKAIKWDPFYNYELNCPLYWMDGRRNTEQIARLSATELGKDFSREYLNEMIEYFQFLKENGYIDF